MKWTILGSGGCMVIPKPLCRCRVCHEARTKGIPYARSGPSAFLNDINLLIDTPAEIISQLNHNRIDKIDRIMLTHLDLDHVEGLRVVEQTTLDFRSWRAYPEKQITLLLPKQLHEPLGRIASQYGSVLDFYLNRGFIKLETFNSTIQIGAVHITALPVNRGSQIACVYVFKKEGRKVIYAPCDIKPFPEDRHEVKNTDVLIIQPGIFETGLKHGFIYPPDHISRQTLYTFEQTLALAERLQAREVVFVHLEEYWNRSYDDYKLIESQYPRIRFAYDGMRLDV